MSLQVPEMSAANRRHSQNAMSNAADAAKLKKKIRDMEKRGAHNLEQLSEIERLRAKVTNLEEGNTRLVQEKTKLENMIRDQYSRDILDLIEDIYSQMEMRFDMTRRNVKHPTNKKILEALFIEVHRLSMAFGPIPPTKEQLWDKIHEFFSYITSDGQDRQKKIDKKTKSRSTSCRTLIEALEKNPFMKDPPLPLADLKLMRPGLKAAYMSSDEEIEEMDPLTRRKKVVIYTRVLPWESKDFCEAKRKLDKFYYRILNPKNPDKIPIKDDRCNISRRRLVKNASPVVTDDWLTIPRERKSVKRRTPSAESFRESVIDD